MSEAAIVNPGELLDALKTVVACAPNGISEGTLVELIGRADVGRRPLSELYSSNGKEQSRIPKTIGRLKKTKQVRIGKDGRLYPTGAPPKMTARHMAAKRKRDEVLAALANGPMTTSELGERFGVTRGRVRHFMTDLGDAVDYSENQRTRERTWFLAGTAVAKRAIRFEDAMHLFPATTRELADALGVSVESMGKTLSYWHRRGHIRGVRIKGRNLAYRYELKEAA